MLKKLKYHWGIAVVITGSVFLRLLSSAKHSYSNDELSAISRLRFSNFSDLLELGVMKGDMHPAGVQVFMKLWGGVFGLGEFSMRLPFILMSVSAIFLMYLIGIKWFSRGAAVLACGLMAVLCFPVIQGELARPYSFGLLAVMITAYFFDKVLFNKTVSWRHAIGLGIGLSLAMYSHYFALLFVGFIGLTGLFFVNRFNFKFYLIGCILGCLLFLPHFGITYYHLSVGGLGWLKAPENDWLIGFCSFVFNDSVFLIFGILGLTFIGILITLKNRLFNRGIFLSSFWFIGIYLIGHILSYTVTPLLKYPVMIFVLPFFLLLVGFFISQIKLNRVLIPILIAGALMSTVFESNLLDNKHYATFGELAAKLEGWKGQYKNQKITLFGNINNEDYLNFYTQEKLNFVKSNFEYGEELEFRKLLKEAKTFYCAYVFASRETPVQFFETALEIYPGIVDGYQGFNSAVYLLHKRESKIIPETRVLKQYNARQMLGEWELNEGSKIKDVYLMDEFDIYGPSCTIEVAEVNEGEYVKVSVTGVVRQEPEVTVGINILRDGELLEKDDEIFWMGFDIDIMLQEAGEGYFAFKIPSFARPTDLIKISLWNRGENPFYLTSIGVAAKENIWNSYTP